MSGPLPSSWVLCKFGDIARIRNGYAFKSEWFKDTKEKTTDVPLIRQSQLKGPVADLSDAVYLDGSYLEAFYGYRIQDGDVLIGMSGSIGKVCVYKGGQLALQNQRTGKIEVRDGAELNPKFLGLYLSSVERTLVQFSKGMGVQNISGKDIEGLPYALPPLKEQQRIVVKIEELFSELEKGIENLKLARAQLTVYRQALLKHAFEGKLTADWRAADTEQLESGEQLLGRIKAERAARYQKRLAEWAAAVKAWEAGDQKEQKPRKPREPRALRPLESVVREHLDPLPPSWAWDVLGLMTSGVEYGTAAKSEKSGTHVVLRMGNLQSGRIDWSDLAFSSDAEEIAQYLLHPGDVLFNRTNSPEWVGKTSMYKGVRPALFAGYLIRINHCGEVVLSEYLNWFLNSPTAKQYGNTVKTDGVNQSNINGDKLMNYPFPYCSLAEQAEIVRVIEGTISLIDNSVDEIENNLQKSEALRQSILRKAFAGELVPQDPSDEPAAMLLARIRAEGASAQVSTETARKSKARNPIVAKA